jgi:hypothetical protein
MFLSSSFLFPLCGGEQDTTRHDTVSLLTPSWLFSFLFTRYEVARTELAGLLKFASFLFLLGAEKEARRHLTGSCHY